MLRLRSTKPSYFRQLPLLKKMFWAYFALLIFEGALRKWIVPQLTAPLLLLRDPLAVAIIWQAYRDQKWPRRWAVPITIVVVMIGLLFGLQVVFVNVPYFVEIYGLRSYLVTYPLAFILAENIDEEDLKKLAQFTLAVMVPMTLLYIGQYLSPPGGILNKGASEGAVQLNYSGGHVRASGTFSYVVGPINYGVLATAFAFYGFVKPGFVKARTLWLAGVCLIVGIPLIGSRTLVVESVAVILCMIGSSMLGVSQFFKTMKLLVPLLVLAVLASLLPVFNQASDTLVQRFSEANNAEGGGTESTFYSRVFLPVVAPFEDADYSSPLGMGMGYGAAAVQTLVSGTQYFVVGETELFREVNELGWVVGIALSMFKLMLTAFLIRTALMTAQEGEPLPVLLLTATVSNLWFAVQEQPTEQGFMVLGLGMSLAAGRIAMGRIRYKLYPRIVPRGDQRPASRALVTP